MESPVDKFEQAFMTCYKSMTKEDNLTNMSREEYRVDQEQSLQKIVDAARLMESYFLKKRLQIIRERPDLLIKDDTAELKLEFHRKEDLLKRNHEKIAYWQSILENSQSTAVIGKPVGPNVPMGASVTGSGPGSAGPYGVQCSTPSGGPPSHGTSSIPSPLTPMSGRPLTPASVGRPLTPSSSGQPLTPGGSRIPPK